MSRPNVPPMYLREATLTYRMVRGAPRTLFPEKPITCSEDVDMLLRPVLAARIAESLVVLALTARFTVIGLHEVARGSVTQVHCRAGDMFRYPLIVGAASLILAHNHPSGNCGPSPEDIALTCRTARLAQELGLSVLDHIILAQDGYFSLLDAGLLRVESENVHAAGACAEGRGPGSPDPSPKRLELGRVYSTRGAKQVCPWPRIAACLREHMRGNWGPVDPEDAAANDRALKQGGRILSCYPIDPEQPAEGDNRLWIVTEHDRSLTTCMLPDEY